MINNNKPTKNMFNKNKDKKYGSLPIFDMDEEDLMENSLQSDSLDKESEEKTGEKKESFGVTGKYRNEDDNSGTLLEKIWWFIKPSVICALILLFLLNFVVIYAIVPTGSMENTIMTTSYILANRRAYDFANVESGDIIVFETDQSSAPLLVKRVIAVAGDTVSLKDGNVYINGNKIEEQYVVGKTEPMNYGSEFFVPAGCVLCFGDNREMSADARDWLDPYLPLENIKGKVFMNYSFKDWYFKFLDTQKYETISN